MSDLDLDDLRAELDEFAQPEKKAGARRARSASLPASRKSSGSSIRHGRAPQHGEHNDIFERLYAVRLDRLRALEECRSLLSPLDRQGLLAGAETAPGVPAETMSDDELLAELGVRRAHADITELRHVRTTADKRAAEEIANRQPCEDFERFKPLFEQVQQELADGHSTDPAVRAEG